MPEPKPGPKPLPKRHPISTLGLITEHVEGSLAASEAQLATLGTARERPAVLDDAAMARVKRRFSEQREFVASHEAQVGRWQALTLDAATAARVAALAATVARLRKVTDAVLALAEELAEGTSDRVLATSDLEVGLRTLTGEFPIRER